MTEAKGYPGFLKKGFTPFDPLWLARLTEEKVCRGLSRKYTDFYCTGVYGGISTAYAVGCCLRCVFCWVDFSRDFPVMSAEERRNLLRRLRETGYRGYLEEEVCDPYRASLVRLKAAGYEIF